MKKIYIGGFVVLLVLAVIYGSVYMNSDQQMNINQDNIINNNVDNTNNINDKTNIPQQVNEDPESISFDFDKNPKVIQKDMVSGRYSISFEIDQPIKFTMMKKENWDNNQYLGRAKIRFWNISTLGQNIDVNTGEDGLYVFIFDDENNLNPTQGVLLITRNIRF